YPLELPYTPGVEGAGRVTEVGAQVQEFKVGDRVAWQGTPGGYAQQALIPVDAAVPVPDEISDEFAAATLLQGITAHYLVTSTFPVGEDDTVLIHAASGGVGLLLVQLAKLRGARVIGTVSTADKEQLARQVGADEIIRYTEEDFTE